MSQDGVGPKGSMQQPSQHPSAQHSQHPAQQEKAPQQPAPGKKGSYEDNDGEEEKETKKKSDPVKAPVGDKEVDFKNISLEEAFDILKVLVFSHSIPTATESAPAGPSWLWSGPDTAQYKPPVDGRDGLAAF